MVANGDCYPNTTAIGTASINDTLGGVIKTSFNDCHQHFAKDPDMEWLVIDSTVIRAHSCAAGALKTSGGQTSQALGRSRGGFSTKIHVAVDGLGNPLRFMLTEGQRHDITCAEATN